MRRKRAYAGICLGFQAIAETFGASLRQLPSPRHGHPSRLTCIDEKDPWQGASQARPRRGALSLLDSGQRHVAAGTDGNVVRRRRQRHAVAPPDTARFRHTVPSRKRNHRLRPPPPSPPSSPSPQDSRRLRLRTRFNRIGHARLALADRRLCQPYAHHRCTAQATGNCRIEFTRQTDAAQRH